MQGGAAEGAGYKPSEESLQRFWEHCENILDRAAVEVPEASLDADTQAQRLAHAKLEQACPHSDTWTATSSPSHSYVPRTYRLGF